MMKSALVSFAVLLACSSTTFAQISEADAQHARDARMAVFKLLSTNMEPLANMARGRQDFDAVLAERNARKVTELALMIPEVFAVDTRGVPIYTRAKDFIWDNWDTFVDLSNELNRQAGLMAEAAASGDQSAFTQAMRATGPACGMCHDLFRFQDSDPALPVPRPD